MAYDVIDQLLRIQDLDLRIVQMEQELAAVPTRRDAIEQGLTTFRATIDAGGETRKQAQMDVHKVELDIETQRQKMVRLREQQLTLKTNREFRAMEDEIGKIEAVVGNLETRLLEAMETVDGWTREISADKDELAQAQTRVEREKTDLDARARRLEAELESLRQQRATVTQAIAAPWLSAYERLFAGKRDRVLVAVEKGACGGCHMKLPPAVPHAVRRAEAMVTCDFCGRMLYSPERMGLA